MTHRIFSDAEIAAALAGLPGWTYAAPNIEAEYAFASFADAMAFILQVAMVAEAMNHHPEFRNSYNRVAFSFCTHDVGNKVTDTDVALARKIDAAAQRLLTLKSP